MKRRGWGNIFAVLTLTVSSSVLAASPARPSTSCEDPLLGKPFNAREFWAELTQIDSKYISPSSNGLSGYFLMPMLYKKDALWNPGVLDNIAEERRSFQDIINLLPKLKAMGKNMLWLSPVHPQTTLHWENDHNDPNDRDEFNNHLYWVSDHGAVADMLGGEAKFKELIDAARAQGIEICLDTVLNHFGYLDRPDRSKERPKTMRMGGKTVSLTDPEYFRPIDSTKTRNKQVPSAIYDMMASETDPGRVREHQQDLTRFSLANLYSFNHRTPAVREYLINSYKHFVDLGIRVFRLDAVKHIPQDFIYEFINELNAYAADRHEKLTFILEFLEHRDTTLDVFVKDLIANVHDNERVYFLDFPLARELRRLQDPRFRLDQMMGFINWRENRKHPLMRYIPMVEDHDLQSPIKDPFMDRLIYLMAEFFSYNPVILHHGQEGANATRNAAREPIQEVDADGAVNKLVNQMGRIMEPYRQSVLLNQTLPHVVESDLVLLEKVRSPEKSLLLLASRKPIYQTRTIRLPEYLWGRNAEVRILSEAVIDVKNNSILFRSDKPFYAVIEILDPK